jgi:hypothetical protein
MPEEYYIRTPDSEEARGPFTVDQLQSLAEAKKIDRETLCYNEESELWTELAHFEGLTQQVFPEKKKLQLKVKKEAPEEEGGKKKRRKKDDTRPLGSGDVLSEEEQAAAAAAMEDADEPDDEPEEEEEDEGDGEDDLPEHSVEEMLAAAEGETEGTEYLKRRAERQAAAASMSLPGLGLIMILSAVSMIYPYYPAIQIALEEEVYTQLFSPLLVFGGLDLLVGIFLLLAVSEIFPVVRFRAAIGLGFWSYIFWASGDPQLMWLVIAGHVSVFVCTMTLNIFAMMAGLAAGIVCFGTLAYLSVTGVLNTFL